MFSMAMNVEAEIRDLKRRVSEIEGSFGFLTQQIKGVHRDLLAFQARTEQRSMVSMVASTASKTESGRSVKTCPVS